MIRDKTYQTAIVESGGMGGDADMLREIYSSKMKSLTLPDMPMRG